MSNLEIIINAVNDVIKTIKNIAYKICKLMTDVITALQEYYDRYDFEDSKYNKNYICVSKNFVRKTPPLRNYIMDLSQYNRKIMKSRCKIV